MFNLYREINRPRGKTPRCHCWKTGRRKKKKRKKHWYGIPKSPVPEQVGLFMLEQVMLQTKSASSVGVLNVSRMINECRKEYDHVATHDSFFCFRAFIYLAQETRSIQWGGFLQESQPLPPMYASPSICAKSLTRRGSRNSEHPCGCALMKKLQENWIQGAGT